VEPPQPEAADHRLVAGHGRVVVNQIDDLLTALAGCLCAQIAASDTPEPCFCGVMPGIRIAVDYVGLCEDKDGMAWTSLALAYPAAGVGVVDQSVNNCSTGIGIEIQIGVMRSAPTMDTEGNPPDEASQLATSQIQTADMISMIRAVQCCEEMQAYDHILSQYTSIGPEGYAVGGYFTVMVAL
jgi:hypothetical protein